MGATVNVNNRSVVHSASTGMTCVFPSVCIVPPDLANMKHPVPYPTFAGTAVQKQKQQSAGAVAKKSTPFKTSSGDEAGSRGVVANTKGKAEFMLYSFDVKFEGEPVIRHEVMQLHNSLNQLNAQLQKMTSSDPDVWQRVVQDYVVAVSALYVTLRDDD